MNAKLVESLKEHPVKYAHLLGFDLLTDIHNEWMKTMMRCKEDYTLLGHRGSYKTTCLSIVFALLIVLRPNKTVFFIRKTDDDVTEIVRQTTKILETDLFRYIVKEIYGVDLVLTTQSSFKIDTNLNTGTRGQVQLQGMGLNGSLTGKHADYVFTDDIVNVRDRASRAERERTKTQYDELQNIKNRGGRIFNTGTPWHRNDCITEKMPNVHKYTVYDTGLISPAQLKFLRDSMSPSLFAANYELKHIADKDALFTFANWLEDSAENTALIYDGIGHIDAAYGGDDNTAYTIFHELPDNRIIGYGHIWNKHVDDCIDAIRAFHNLYRAGSVSCETNGDKGYLAGELEKEGFLVHDYAEHMNKYVKIATYLKKNWSRIWWVADTDPDYINNILDYNEWAEHDDAPDSAAARGKAKILAQELGITEREYRKMLARIRRHLNLTERKLTQKQVEKIRYEAVPARAMMKYRAAFERNDTQRFVSFLEEVEQGKQRMHAGTLDPPEILRPYFNASSQYLCRRFGWSAAGKKALEALWRSQEGQVGSRNALCVVDTSGSMYWSRPGMPLPALFAQALGLFFAERSEGIFRNHIITFENVPHLMELRGETLEDRLRYLQSAPWGNSTNLSAVFNLVLRAAVEMKAAQEEMPAVLYILSDMEFNIAFRRPNDTVFEDARKEYALYGYELPAVVFHNVNAWRTQTPVRADTKGTALVSGARTSAMSAKYTKDTTPMSYMLEVLGSERYRKILA